MRTGSDYLRSISAPRGVYLDGQRVENVPEHAAFRGPARTIGRLFDLAADPANDMIYTAPETGRDANRVFMIPRNRADLAARRAALEVWSGATEGFIGRGPEHVAGFFAGFAGGADIFGSGDRCDFAENVRAFQRRILDESLYVSYTILPPQFDRSTSAGGWDDEFIQAGVVEQTDEGIVVRGSMALGTAAPLSDYLFVSCIKPLSAGDETYANSFVVPIGTPGLRLICRKPYGAERASQYNYPLANRFDESDCFAVFDDVLVPWEHVFVLGDPALLREQFFRTSAHLLGNSQAQIRFAAKLKFILGVARKITMTNGIDRLPPVQDKLGELASLASLVEGMTIAAEASSQPDEFGVERPNPRFLYGIMAQQADLYPRIIQIVRDLSGVGVLQLPAGSAEFEGVDTGRDIERYMRSPGVEAEERVKLFKLAWDIVGSEFAGRHQQYELFYAGAPFIVRAYAFRNYRYEEPIERVERFLASYTRRPATDNAESTPRPQGDASVTDRDTVQPSLNEALAEQRSKGNPDVVKTIMAANSAVQQSGEAAGLAVGDKACDFELPDATGDLVRLTNRLALGPVVLTFYRGEWCPYCNITLAALQHALDDIKAEGASLIAISPQRPDQALSLTERHDLKFDVLSDVNQSVIRDYRVQFRVSAEVEDIHLNTFKKDISQLNADGSWNLPVPATFIIDGDGIVRARYVGAEYTHRMEPAEILDALRGL